MDHLLSKEVLHVTRLHAALSKAAKETRYILLCVQALGVSVTALIRLDTRGQTKILKVITLIFVS